MISSAVLSLLFQEQLHVNSKSVFQNFRHLLKQAEVQMAHESEKHKAGNCSEYNVNTKEIIGAGRHDNIFRAASKILYKTDQLAYFMQITCYEMMSQNPYL